MNGSHDDSQQNRGVVGADMNLGYVGTDLDPYAPHAHHLHSRARRSGEGNLSFPTDTYNRIASHGGASAHLGTSDLGVKESAESRIELSTQYGGSSHLPSYLIPREQYLASSSHGERAADRRLSAAPSQQGDDAYGSQSITRHRQEFGIENRFPRSGSSAASSDFVRNEYACVDPVIERRDKFRVRLQTIGHELNPRGWNNGLCVDTPRSRESFAHSMRSDSHDRRLFRSRGGKWPDKNSRRGCKRLRMSKDGDDAEHCRRRGALGGVKFFKAYRPRDEEAEADLWCRVCKRGFQDANAKATHDRSKAHRQAVEEARRLDEENPSENDSDGVEEVSSHFVEKPIVDNDMVRAMIESGGHEKAPKAFKDWANRSIRAAQAKNDPGVTSAVVREIAEELTVQNMQGTINLQSWKRRENATGQHFMDAEPKMIKIPMFEVSKKIEHDICEINERSSKRNLCSGLGNNGCGDVAHCAAMARPEGDPTSPSKHKLDGTNRNINYPEFHAILPSVDPRVSLLQSQGQAAGKASCGDKSETWSNDVNVDGLPTELYPCTNPAANLQAVDGRKPTQMKLESGSTFAMRRGFRKKPTLAEVAECDTKSLVSICTSRRASQIYDVCRGDNYAVGKLVGALYCRDIALPRRVACRTASRESANSRDTREACDPSESNIWESLDSLTEEFRGSYSFPEFSAKLENFIDTLEGLERPCYDVLRRAYELYVDATLPQDHFGKLVLPCARLMDLYNALSDSELTRRDEFTAYHVMSLIIKPSATTARSMSRLEKYNSGSKWSLPGKLARICNLGFHGSRMTKLGLNVVQSVLAGNYVKFFRLYVEGDRIGDCDGRLQMLMDGFTDLVRSNAIKVIYQAVDQPCKYPLRDLMQQLMWYHQPQTNLPVSWRREEAREFILGVGTVVEVKSDDGKPLSDSSNEYMACNDPKIVRCLKLRYDVVNPLVLS